MSRLLGLSENQLALIAASPEYYFFRLPKPDGSLREIEAPAQGLKRVQRKINDYLQAVYFTIKPDISYGYIKTVRRDDQPRNLVTHAQQHLGARYLMNVDFEDFFYQIKAPTLIALLSTPPFGLNKYTAHLLAKVCTYENRLPMGAPTSPVLSNLACIGLDKALHHWASNHQFKITRFVDDISVSSKSHEIHLGHFLQLAALFKRFGFFINADKTRYYGEDDAKVVTGLRLGRNSVNVLPEFLQTLDADLLRLKSVVEVDVLTGRLPQAGMIKKFKQEVMGKINFLSQVNGKESIVYHEYLNRFEEAIATPPDVFSARWVHFNYLC